MVLINGVKYACERCIRGHRVTTCTHTDQPLMMIKPKGRPPTQCGFCKQQRKIRNSHSSCKCAKKPNSGEHHDSSCPCHISGKCTCCDLKKKKNKGGKDREKEAEAEAALTPIGKATPDSLNSTPTSSNANTNTNTNKNPKIAVTTQQGLLLQESSNLPRPFEQKLNLQSPTISEYSGDFRSNIQNSSRSNLLDSEDDNILRDNEISPDVENDEMNRLLNSWDMSPFMGNSDSLVSSLSDTSLLNNDYYKRQNGQTPQINQQLHQQRSNQQNNISGRRGIGEITLPIDEYMKPLNKMNVHFNNFLNNLSDNQSGAPTNNGNAYTTNISNINSYNVDDDTNGNDNNNNSNFLPDVDNLANIRDNTDVSTTEYSSNNNRPENMNFGFSQGYNSRPVSRHNGNPSFNEDVTQTPGLLDFFETNEKPDNNDHSIPYIKENPITNHPNFNYSKSAAIPDHEAASLFPFFSLIGPQSADDVAIGQTKSFFSQDMNQVQPKLSQNLTGSSEHSNYSLHSLKSNQSHQSLQSLHSHHSHHSHHQHHHNGSHSHIHQSHFRPYPTKPRRTGSVLSVNSSNSIHSTNSINSELSSPGSVAEIPQSYVGSIDLVNEYNGPQLANAKTNTTLTDGIYQTKTYTENQSVFQQPQPSQQLKPDNDDDLTGQVAMGVNNISSPNPVFPDNFLSFDQIDESITNDQHDSNVNSIGTVPITSSLFISPQSEQENYDEQLFQSLMDNQYT